MGNEINRLQSNGESTMRVLRLRARRCDNRRQTQLHANDDRLGRKPSCRTQLAELFLQTALSVIIQFHLPDKRARRS